MSEWMRLLIWWSRTVVLEPMVQYRWMMWMNAGDDLIVLRCHCYCFGRQDQDEAKP